MLSHLRISNYLLIEELELDFYSGLTVVTGETGSGKSIIIDALSLIFGARATRDIVRVDSSAAKFEAVFHISNHCAISWLQENDLLDMDNPESVICRRIIDNQGKSKIQINGHSVTALQIRALGDYLLAIHAQHSSITLLRADTQRNLLDQFCGIGTEVANLADIYKQIKDLEEKLSIVNEVMRGLELKREILTEEINELSALNLQDDEWDNLQTEHKQLSNAKEILGTLDCTLEMLFGNDEQSLITTISKIHAYLNKLTHYVPKLVELLKITNSIDIELHELTQGINQIAQHINQNPQRLIDLEARMEEIFAISRKYRHDPAMLPEILLQLEQELAELNQNSDSAKLEEQLDLAKASYVNLANIVSKKRATGADKLATAITKLFPAIALNNGQFHISLSTTEKANSYGLENVEYQICLNLGMQLQPLASAASGGELSRVALALYLLLSIHNPPEIIIFDEIDAGIGGRVAAVVGQMLAELGANKQVICITHQAQTASFGTNHLVVTKTQDMGKTITQVGYIAKDARIAEIARMLGGVQITEATLVHAKEMLAQQYIAET